MKRLLILLSCFCFYHYINCTTVIVGYFMDVSAVWSNLTLDVTFKVIWRLLYFDSDRITLASNIIRVEKLLSGTTMVCNFHIRGRKYVIWYKIQKLIIKWPYKLRPGPDFRTPTKDPCRIRYFFRCYFTGFYWCC